MRTAKIMGFSSFIALLIALSVRIPLINTGYDVLADFSQPAGQPLYNEVANYILDLKPDAKVYSTNPILEALYPQIQPALYNDAFAQLFLEKQSVSDFLDELEREGTDFIVLDPWARWWQGGQVKLDMDELQEGVRSRYKLATVIGSTDSDLFEIYSVGESGEPIFDPDFKVWPAETSAPVGWNLTINSSTENSASMTQSSANGQTSIGFKVSQGSMPSPGDWTQVSLGQTISYSGFSIQVPILPAFNYRNEEAGWPLCAAGVQVSDSQNHRIWFTFSSLITSPTSYDLPDSQHVEVLYAPLGEWSTQTINIQQIYDKLGWGRPDSVTLELFLAVHVSQPGVYSASFGPITIVS